jgi:hypothetical protein
VKQGILLVQGRIQYLKHLKGKFWSFIVNKSFWMSSLTSNKPIGATPQRHFLGGEGGAWYETGVTLRGLRISKKKEILRKLTVL